MRVDYTLPGLDPGSLPELPASVETGRSFSDQLRSPAVELPLNWQHELHLDARPATATNIGPPPRPPSLEMGDSASERTRWRSMLSRHNKALAAADNSNAGADTLAVSVMLDMLSGSQDAEDSIVYHNGSVTRG